MNRAPITDSDDYTQDAAKTVLVAARTEHDFAGSLASVLAEGAAEFGSSDATTAGRPGSCAADLVQQLTKGTVDPSNELLADYEEPLP